MADVELIEKSEQLEGLAHQLRGLDRVALDTEGNGMFVFRARLCVVQLCWQRGDSKGVAIIDALALDMDPLAELLCEDGPIKLLHDLTFDARILQSVGLQLGNVRDTSVTARFLGEDSTGLAALVASRCGVELGKGLQNHNWALRPFTDRQLDYLANDVLHLHALDDALRAEANALDIEPEVADECAYKLEQALAPPRTAPSYQRIKGFRKLDDVRRAVLRRLVHARDAIAEDHDLPPHRIAPARVLAQLARDLPKSDAGIRQRWRGRWAKEYSPRMLSAIRQGIDDGEVPPEELPSPPPPPPPTERARRKRLDRALNAWRKQEADERGVDLQVVMPGHCMAPVASALLDDDPLARLSSVEGIGKRRLERYAEALCSLASRAQSPEEDA